MLGQANLRYFHNLQRDLPRIQRETLKETFHHPLVGFVFPYQEVFQQPNYEKDELEFLIQLHVPPLLVWGLARPPLSGIHHRCQCKGCFQGFYQGWLSLN